MILRSQLLAIQSNPTLLHIPATSKFFFSEKEANDFYATLGNVVKKIDQWQVELDNMTESEKAERFALAEEKVQERASQNPHMNEAQKNLLRQFISESIEMWSVSVVSGMTPDEFFAEGIEYGTYDDEINGATPVMAAQTTEHPASTLTAVQEFTQLGEAFKSAGISVHENNDSSGL